MKTTTLSTEKRNIIDSLLATTGVTLDELFRSHELNANQQRNPLPVRYLSIDEARQICPVSRFTLRRWMKKDWIRFCKLSNARGGRVLIEANSLFAFLESRSRGAIRVDNR